MKRTNHLSENLRVYQKMKGCTQAEYSAKPGVPTSTLQTMLNSGNTTLHPADAMNISLDEPMLSRRRPEVEERSRQLMQEGAWYWEMTEARQKAVCHHVSDLVRPVNTDEG